MAKNKRKRTAKTVLKLPALEQSKSAVLNSPTSRNSQRSYDHAIREFIDWYCSEPRLAFNKTVGDPIREDAFYLRRNVNWFYPEERASLLVGQQIQQPVWTLLDLTDSLLELGQQWLAADRQSIRRTEDDAL